MTICDPDRTQAATDMAAAMRTLDESPLTRTKGDSAAHVRLNAGMAILCAYAAHRHLSGQSTQPDEELLGIARSHLRSAEEQAPVLAALSGIEAEDCWAVDDTRGMLSYYCSHDDGFEPRNFPCISCPLVTRQLPDAVEPLNLAVAEAPLPNLHPDPVAAVRDAGETLDAIQRATDALRRCPAHPELLAAAIAIANAAYYTVTAVEWHPPHIGRRQLQRLVARELEIADDLYLAMGGDPERGTIKPTSEEEPYCVRMLMVPREGVKFICEAPEGNMPPEATPDGLTEVMCQHCMFRTHEPRPRIDQLAGRRQ